MKKITKAQADDMKHLINTHSLNELENKAKTDTTLKYKLSVFNNAQKKFLAAISKVVIAFTNRFNTNFNNSLENISLSYIGFNFNLFYKICESFTNNRASSFYSTSVIFASGL